ncbi:ssu-2 homolog, tandem duplicate 2 isoform X2 [Scleropages formosus]|uniref:Ssu-2 homolog, tandem duplicate 4 n=1 Tax=Scleropages formosus TaxID=113540 RepID=A0A8C9V0C2_SCLFO|nr:protein SSUH2 homolog isoform X2 [Scleropages formosus]
MDQQRLLSDQDEATGGTTPNQQHPAVAAAGADDPNKGEGDMASAPPAELMDVVPGYEGIGSAGHNFPPPIQGPSQVPVPTPQPSNAPWQIPSISEELAKEVFIEFASQRCCYSATPAKEMVFTDLQSLNTYRYRLETFTETRTTAWASEPFNGQTVDGFLGVAPGPWDLNVPVPALFQNGSEKVRIPYTSSVKGCHSCLSLGKRGCERCVTSGRMQCSVCNGSGRNLNDRCTRCSGAGRVRCTICSGVGSLTCKTCKGKGQLLCYIKLTVKWKNNLYECVVDKQSGFPIDKISKVTGETMFTDMNARVYPVVGFPDDAINRASVQAVREHQAQFASTSRILQQRQTIELIPITRVHYSWRNKTYIYFVFGAEHKVHTDDYPAKCCCCSIL